MNMLSMQDQIQAKRAVTYRHRWIEKINANWPGGIDQAMADYAQERCTLKDIERRCHMRYKSMVKLWNSYGVTIRVGSDACRTHHRLHPERAAAVAAKLKLTTSATRPQVRAKFSQAKSRMFALHPERHPNAKQGMSCNEERFAAILGAMGLEWEFNKHVAPYWLDFYVPALRVGFELEIDKMLTSRARDKCLISGIAAPVLYIKNRDLRSREREVTALLQSIASGAFNLARLASYRLLAHKLFDGQRGKTVAGFLFVVPWWRARLSRKIGNQSVASEPVVGETHPLAVNINL